MFNSKLKKVKYITQVYKWMKLYASFLYFFKFCSFGVFLYVLYITPTLLLDAYFVLPVY